MKFEQQIQGLYISTDIYVGKMHKRILVSVLTYNGGDKTLRTLGDIFSQVFDHENCAVTVLLVDNCSVNGISDLVQEKFKRVKCLKTSENLGYAGGCNIAIEFFKEEQFDYLFVLNDDLRIDSNYIQGMLDGIDSIKEPSAAFGSTIRLVTGHIQAVSGILKWWSAGVTWDNKKRSKGALARAVDVVQGAALILPKSSIQQGFRFDDRLFFGGEEYDLGCWAKRMGTKIYVIEDVEVVHDTNQVKLVTNRWQPDKINYYYAVRNIIYVTRKYSQSNFLIVFSLGFFLTRVCVKSLIFAIFGNPGTSLAILKGIRDGVIGKTGKYKD